MKKTTKLTQHHSKYVMNGKEYDNFDNIPETEKNLFDHHRLLKDENKNGTPDLFQQSSHEKGPPDLFQVLKQIINIYKVLFKTIFKSQKSKTNTDANKANYKQPDTYPEPVYSTRQVNDTKRNSHTKDRLLALLAVILIAAIIATLIYATQTS